MSRQIFKNQKKSTRENILTKCLALKLFTPLKNLRKMCFCFLQSRQYCIKVRDIYFLAINFTAQWIFINIIKRHFLRWISIKKDIFTHCTTAIHKSHNISSFQRFGNFVVEHVKYDTFPSHSQNTPHLFLLLLNIYTYKQIFIHIVCCSFYFMTNDKRLY